MEQKEKFLIKLGTKIAQYRKGKNFSQEELAFLVKTAPNYIGCIERAEKCPSLRFLKKLAKTLDIKVKDLIDF